MRDLASLVPGKLKVLIDVSNKCNLRCTMCHFSFDKVFYRPAEHMKPEDFQRVAAEVFPYAHTVVLSAGSEPTVSPYFAEILHLASRWPLQELKFLTNATRLTKTLAATILDSSVTQIDISIDGACAETYEKIRRGGRFENVVNNIRHMRDMKHLRGLTAPLMQFNVTLMRSNLLELDQFVDLAEECGVERIGCRHLMPYAGLDVAAESLFDIPMEANRAFRRFVERVERSPTVQLITFPDFFAEGDVLPRGVDERAALQGRLNGAAVRFDGDTTLLPYGYIDLPAPDVESVASTLHLAGWALDAESVESVALVSGGPGCWVVHELAKRVNGSRPDVAAHFPDVPGNSAAGWVCDARADRLPRSATAAIQLHAIAVNRRGYAAVLGSRTLRAPAPQAPAAHVGETPFLFCQKPFNSIYIDSNGDVYPYPDCRPEKPSGNLLRGENFISIWHGEEQTKLRNAIVASCPPGMCKTCPNFINRNPDDAAFFKERNVVQGYAEIPLDKIKRSSTNVRT